VSGRTALILLVGCCLVLEIALAGECNRFVVSSREGYTNVRSEPRVSADTLVAAIPAGAVIDGSPGAARQYLGGKGWQRVDSPVAGWIHGSQLKAIGCEGPVTGSADAGLKAIVRLAHKARFGDKRAAQGFLALSRGVDGALAEVYVDEIGNWALKEPATLAAALRGQSGPIRDAAMEMIDLGLEGASLDQRGRFRIELLHGNP
jgi:hypothetical protein